MTEENNIILIISINNNIEKIKGGDRLINK